MSAPYAYGMAETRGSITTQPGDLDEGEGGLVGSPVQGVSILSDTDASSQSTPPDDPVDIHRGVEIPSTHHTGGRTPSNHPVSDADAMAKSPPIDDLVDTCRELQIRGKSSPTPHTGESSPTHLTHLAHSTNDAMNKSPPTPPDDPVDMHRDLLGDSPGGHSAPQRCKMVLDPRVEYSEFRIHILTWNVASAEPSHHDLQSLFLPQKTCMMDDMLANSDILVVGLQEAYQSVHDAMQSSVPLMGRDPLVESFSSMLSQKGFARLCFSRLLGILTLVFVKRPLLCYIGDVETSTTKTGLSGWLGNKGGSSIRFSLGDLSMCFTNCHLAPHLENNPRRVQELAEIFATQSFSSPPSQLMEHDVLILFGDLNFRLEGKSPEEVIATLTRGWGVELLSSDQLRLEQILGDDSPSRLFNFMEMPISFPPSYKFEPGSDVYEPGPKGRAPAWCDRILWRTHERCLPLITDPEPRSVLTQQHYAIHMQPRISDHKAVSAGMTVSINLMGFVPRVVFNIMSEWVSGKTGVVAVEMEPDTVVSMWDWVGLYPADFVCLEKDYVYWMYTPVKGKVVRGRVYRRPLPSDQVPKPGRYMMLYKSSYYNCVLGMSPIFPIR